MPAYSQMIDRIGRIAEMTKTPVIADADTGYGGLLNVRHTVRGYEKAGVTAIQIEDQEFPEEVRPHAGPARHSDRGHGAQDPGRVRQPLERRLPRSSRAPMRGPAAAWMRRSGAASPMREAGADIIFVESPESEEEMAEIGRRIDKPLLANMVNGGRTPMLPGRQAAGSSAFRSRSIRRSASCRPARRCAAPTPTCSGTAPPSAAVPMYSFSEFNELDRIPGCVGVRAPLRGME